MKSIILSSVTLILLLLVTNTFGYTSKVPIKYGKILKEDLDMKSYLADPSAPAVILCDYGTVRVGPRTEYLRHVRIKILSDKGLKYANIEIPFRYLNQYEKIQGLKAQTFNINEKGEIVKTKLKSSSIRELEMDKRNHCKVFSLPDVKVGSVIEYTYTIVSLDCVKLRDWYFQNSIPVVWSEYRISVPFKFNYLVTYQKGKPLDIQDQKGIANKIQWLYDTKLKKAHRELFDQNDMLYESPSAATTVYFINGRTMKFVMKNMAALRIQEESPIPDISQQVKVHLFKAEGMFPFYYDYMLQTANDEYDNMEIGEMRMNRNRRGYIAYFLPTWEEMNSKWLKSDNLGTRLYKAFEYKPLLDAAIQKGGTKEQLAGNIFNALTENVKWNGQYGIYADKNFDKVLKNKEGSGPEMNLMLAFLLKRAGFNVEIVLVKTKDKGRLENIYPVKDQFNHLLVQLIIEDKAWYLDASGKNPAFGQLQKNIEGVDGWLLRKENYGWVTIADKEPTAQITTL